MPHQRSVGKSGRPNNRFKIAKWRRYETEICQRERVTVWATDRALVGWRAPPRKTRGGQAQYSTAVIQMMLLLRRLFHLTLRETEGLTKSIMSLLDLDLPVPDHTTMSRRGGHMAARLMHQFPDGPLHVHLDESGFQVYGHDEPMPDAAHQVEITVDQREGMIFVNRRKSSSLIHAPSIGSFDDSVVGEIESSSGADVRNQSAVAVALGRREADVDFQVLQSQSGVQSHRTIANGEASSALKLNYSPSQRAHVVAEPVNWRAGKDLVQTWLKPPARGGGLVDRRRLADLLTEVSRSTLTFVKAPAGYGKSTVLAQWYEALLDDGAAVGWFSANHTEYNLSKLFRYVVAAIQTSRPQFGARISGMLSATDDFSAESISSVFVNEVLELKESTYLFIDDLHLISDPSSAKAVAIMLGQPPANLHLIVASRQSLPFDASRLKMRGLLAEIGIDWLRFDESEAATFLNLAGHTLSTSEIQTVVAKTEGWAAGIQLASISLAQRKSKFFSLISGEHAEIATFLAEDVLSHLPVSTVDFMERTAILARMNPALCTELTGHPDARAQIDALERQSLFLFSLDEKRQWYRYHHLFADFLQRRLKERNPELFVKPATGSPNAIYSRRESRMRLPRVITSGPQPS
jgi:hypothetical protein